MGMISSYAKGGKVSGKGGPRDDKINIKASNGEYVIPADVVRKVGTHALDSMVASFHKPSDASKKKKKGYADGGLVGSNVVSDIASEYNRGAQTSPAAGVGLAAREALISPVSRIAGPVVSAARNLAGGAVDAGRAFVTGTPAPAAPSAPAASSSPSGANPYLTDGPPGVQSPATPDAPAPAAPAAPPVATGPGPISSLSATGPDGIQRVSIRDGSTPADVERSISNQNGGIVWVDGRQMGARAYADRLAEAKGRANDPAYQAERARYDAGSVTPSLQRDDNVRAYLNTPGGGLPSWVAPNEIGGTKRLRAYADLQNAGSQAYTAGSGRIRALADSNLAGARAQESGARVGQIGAQTADTQQNIVGKQYSLEQQKNLQSLTTKLQDPNLTDKDRHDLEQQLWILHGKPPRPDNRYQPVPGKFNPMTGSFEPGMVVDRVTGEAKPLGVPGAAKPQGYPEGTKLNGPDGKSYTVKNGQPVAD